MGKKFDTKCELPKYNSDIVTKGMPILKKRNAVKNEIRIINDVKKKIADTNLDSDVDSDSDSNNEDSYSAIDNTIEEFSNSNVSNYTLFITMFIMILCVYYLMYKSNDTEKVGGLNMIRKNLIISVDNDLKYKPNM